MAEYVEFDWLGRLVRSNDPIESCTNLVVMSSTEYNDVFGQLAFDLSNLDPILITQSIAAGYFILVPVWVAAWGLKQLLLAIK